MVTSLYNPLFFGDKKYTDLTLDEAIKLYEDITEYLKNNKEIEFCDKCKRTKGYIYVDRTKEGLTPLCFDCCVAKKQVLRQIVENFSENMERGIFDRYRIEDYKENDITKKVLYNFTNKENNKKEWLYFSGVAGCGKTYSAIICSIFAILQQKSVVMYDEFELMTMLRYDRDNVIDVFNNCRNADLFILDDFGKDSSTDFANNMIFSILNHRERTMKKTIITSNYLVSEDSCDYSLKPLVSRIEANSIIVNFADKNNRKNYSTF